MKTMMQQLFLVLAFAHLATATESSSLRRSGGLKEFSEIGHRDLQTGSCGFIGLFLPGSYNCECGLSENILALEFTFTCTSNTALCLPLCITPAISGSLGFGANTASLEICNNGFDNSGGLNGPAFTLPPFCIKLGGKTNPDSVFADTNDSELDECSMTSKGEQCNSCEICDGGLGYRFNCTNVDEHMVQSTCMSASLLSGFNPDKKVEFGIELDEMP